MPPSELEITDEDGNEIRSIKVGPLREDDWTVLLCRVIGGKPPPAVEWYLNGQLIPSVTSQAQYAVRGRTQQINDDATGTDKLSKLKIDQPRVYIKEVRLGPLTRSLQDSKVTCRASNSAVTDPKNRTVSLEIQRK